MSVSGNGVIMLKLVCLEMVHTLNKTQFVWENGLIGGLEHEFYFSIGNFIIPTDELHHFSEG